MSFNFSDILLFLIGLTFRFVTSALLSGAKVRLIPIRFAGSAKVRINLNFLQYILLVEIIIVFLQPDRALYGEFRPSILIEVILLLKTGKIFAGGNGQTNAHACDMLSFYDHYHIGRELLSIIR